MKKKIRCYLESSALWNLYYQEEGSDLVEYCLTNSQFICFSSIWSHLEIARGIKKRLNQEEITSSEANQLQLFVDTDLRKLVNKKHLSFEQITAINIHNAKRFINSFNLFASDALHFATALTLNCDIVLVDDYHFKRLNPVLMEEEGLKIIPTASSIEILKDTIKEMS